MIVKRIPLSRVDWDDLRVFLEVARHGNLSHAARRLRLNGSTVSRRIAHLESSVGASLLERHPAGIRLSELGQRLQPHVEAMERAAVEMREVVDGRDSAVRGVVRLATMEALASMYLPKRLVGLLRRYPDLHVELVTTSQLINVSRREADVFLSLFKPLGRGLESALIGEVDIVLCTGRPYIERHGMPETVADLAHHVFVSYIDELIQVDTVRWLEEVVTSPAIVFHSNSLEAQMNAAAAGMGIAMLPRFCLDERPDLQPLLADVLHVRRGLWVSVHRDAQFFPRVRAVTSFLAALAERDEHLMPATGVFALA